MQPSSSDVVRSIWKSPNRRCPIAAEATSGTACTRSVPTSSLALSVGYSAISAMMMSDPEPTEVMPTTMPPISPRTIVGTDPEVHRRLALRQRWRPAVAAAGVLQQPEVGPHREPERREQQGHPERDPDDLLDLLALAQRPGDEHPAERARDRADAEPFHQPEVHRAAAQVDERADRLHYRARHQVGGHRGQRRHLKKSTSTGVISAPPPMPVRPTTMPMPNDAIVRSGSMLKSSPRTEGDGTLYG